MQVFGDYNLKFQKAVPDYCFMDSDKWFQPLKGRLEPFSPSFLVERNERIADRFFPQATQVRLFLVGPRIETSLSFS